MEVSDLQITVVDETLIVLRDAATHAVEAHGDNRITLRPTHRTVLAVVGDLPDSGRGLDERLVAIGVVLRLKVGDSRLNKRRGHRFPVFAKTHEAGAGTAHERQF